VTTEAQQLELVLLRKVYRQALAYMVEAPARQDSEGAKREDALTEALNEATAARLRGFAPEAAEWQ
jgi:hypothetical protein